MPQMRTGRKKCASEATAERGRQGPPAWGSLRRALQGLDDVVLVIFGDLADPLLEDLALVVH